MSSSLNFRFPEAARLRGANGRVWLGAALVVTLFLAVWLGLQVIDAERSHRRATERVLADYAGLAAGTFAAAAAEDLDDMLHEVLDNRSRRDWRTESPRSMARNMLEAADDIRCRCKGLREQAVYFRVDFATGESTSYPGGLSTDHLAALGRQVVADYDPGIREPYGLSVIDTPIATPGHQPDRDRIPTAIVYSMAEDTSRAHGFIADYEALGEVFGAVFARSALLPFPVADSLPGDSLVFVTVTDPAGNAVFESPSPYPTDFSASDTLGPEFASLVVQASIRPDAAGRLVIGGLPRSRLPLLATLLALTLGVGVAALVQLRKEHQLARLREDFVSGVSHEFRTPLTQIRMFAELLEDGKLGSEAERRRSIQIITRESRRLSHLVENVLRFSELRRNGSAAEPIESVDLHAAVEEVVAAFRPLADARRASLSSAVEPGQLLETSRTGIHQILTNLVDNALKYGPEGQHVRIDAERTEGAVRMSVEDEGDGISPGDRDRVWEPYRRLDRDVDGLVEGSGLGLAVVADLARRLGGRVWVEDGRRSGARFVVELPLSAARVPASSG
ncbi:MAG: HAMP domain-containing sensor histidine kinase [Gemmatimonadota bacterium]|nr:HAMP domain-containing sensor histidine kinase [Gemmatimonadota bacterium]